MNQVTLLIVLFISVILSVSGCGGSSSSSSSGGNTAPVADAGTDQNIITGSMVSLDGSGSSDANGDSLTYQWLLLSQPAGSASSLPNSMTVNPSFTPLVNGDYVISLVVNDGTVDSAADTVTITAALTANNPPVAVAGNDEETVTGLPVTLDGSNSSDVDGDILTYLWSFQSIPVGSGLSTLLDSGTSAPSFTPDVDGYYDINLVVNDGTVDSTPDTVQVMSAPTAFYAGRSKYDNDCASCHAAGTHDTSTNQGASDLFDDGEKLRTDISIYSPSKKAGVADLTSQEIADLNAFLESSLIEP